MDIATKLMKNINKEMMLSEIKRNGLRTIFDPEESISPNKKDLSDKLGRALEKNELIH
jgi:hypothetical protein